MTSEKPMPFSLNKVLQCMVIEDDLSDGEEIGQVKVPDIIYVAIYYALELISTHS